jgi:hypothetical protein
VRSGKVSVRRREWQGGSAAEDKSYESHEVLKNELLAFKSIKDSATPLYEGKFVVL